MTLAPEQNPNNLPQKPEIPAEQVLAQTTFTEALESSAHVVESGDATTLDASSAKRKRVGIIAAATTAGVVLLGGGTAAGIAIASNTAQEQIQDNPNGEDSTPEEDPAIAQPAPSDLPNPSNTSVPVEVEVEPAPEVDSQINQEIGISSEITDPQELAEAYISNLAAWQNYGEDRALEILMAKVSGGDAAFNRKIDSIVEEAAEKWSAALLPENWQDDPILVSWYNHHTSAHRDILTLKAYTTPESEAYPDFDLEVYRTYSEIQSVVVVRDVEPNKLTLDITEHAYDNHDKNRVGERLTNGQFRDEVGTVRTILTKTDKGWIKTSY